MIYDGKTYRNLESQVGYLTEVAEALDERITEVAANIPSKMIVEELPETGDPNITYYVGPKGTEPNLYYEVWVWVQEVEDGPFVWRELEDTDQVDLSGYLPKVETETTDAQAYVKNADGTQGMVDVVVGTSGGSIVKRTSNGQVSCADPTADNHAVNRGWANQNYRGKLTSVTEKDQAYVKFANGTQGANDIDLAATGYTIPKRYSNGTLAVAYAGSTDPDNRATNIGYCNDHYLAKNTATSSYFQAYCKNTDGTQAMCNANVGVVGGALPLRRSNGNLAVPLTPTEDGDAASKKYVDDNATGVRYIHQLHLTYATAPDEYLTVMATLVNRSSTPITSMSYDVFREMSVQYGDHGSSPGYNPVMVVKCPNSFHGHDFPDPIDGIYWKDLNNSTEGFATSVSMTLSVSDYVSLF